MKIKVKMKVKMKIKQKKQKRAEIFFVFLENFETVKIVIRHIISYRRGERILRSGHFKRFIYSPRRLVCFYVGYRVGNSTPELPWQLSYVELVQKHKLNFLLKNYISKKIFQHIIGTGRSRGAFCYSFCSSGTSVTWEKVAKRGHFS